MKAKQEAPKRRGAPVRKARRAAADPASDRRRATRSGPETSPITRPIERPARPTSRSQAKARAKARKAKAPRAVRAHLTERLAARFASVDLRPRTLASKVPFVVLIIGSLGLGLGLTLWLSTDSAERSYELSHAREKNRLLQEQKESLERDVREAESAPALAEAARKQGMIPTRDTAHLVQDPAGGWVVVGTPKPADGVPPPPLNTKLPEEGPPPPPKPAALPPEVPVRVQPAPGDPAPPARSGPEALLRAPDGSATIGGQHLPQAVPRLPGVPGGQLPGQLPGSMLHVPQMPQVPLPGLPVPGGPATGPAPAEVPIPLGGLPAPASAPVLAPPPVEVPVPVQRAPQTPMVAPVQPGLPQPAPGAPR